MIRNALRAAVAAAALTTSLPAQDIYRPRLHFTPEKNWMNDPNGLVWHDGEWHLFYQYNPFGDRWGHMSWGHAVSRDLLHWEHLPLALAEEDGIMIFSGSAVIDAENSSGFGRDGIAPMVAIYTAHTPENQSQAIAWSLDRGRTWRKYEGNPVLDIGQKDFRDPKVFRHRGSGKWIMTVAWPVERKVRFYSSPDLRSWTHLSDFGPAGSVAGIWECPDLVPFPAPDEAGATKWVLIVNTSDGTPAGGSGGQYFVGDFDGTTFTATEEAPLWLDYGPDFYAGVTWSNVPESDGRRLLVAWMSNWRYADRTPTSPWRSAMSIPRELSLVKTPAGLRLSHAPVRELDQLQDPVVLIPAGTADEAGERVRAAGLTGNALDIRFDAATAHGTAHIDVLAGESNFTRITVSPGTATLSVDRSRSGISFDERFPARIDAPLPAPLPPSLPVRILVDACSVEVFAGGTTTVTALAFPPADARGVRLSGDARIDGLSIRRIGGGAEK